MFQSILSWLSHNPIVIVSIVAAITVIVVAAMFFGIDLMPYIQALKWWRI